MIFDHDLDQILPDGSSAAITIGGVGGIIIPSGTTADRPSAPGGAVIRYNTDTSSIEGFNSNGSTWSKIIVADPNGSTSITNGGTGLTSLGTMNQLIGMNSAANAYEYKSIVQGSGITVTHNAGTITIAAAGGSGTVSSVSVTSTNGFAGTVADASTTPAISISTTVTGPLVGNGTAISAAISGTHFKTINSQSILGAGDLSVVTPPAGSNTHIQFNNSGAFGASPDFAWDNPTKRLLLTGTNTTLLLAGVTNEPTAPADGNMTLYSKSIAGRMYPKWLGPSGLDMTGQPGFGFNRIGFIGPNTGNTVSGFNLAASTTGTVSHPVLASTNYKTQCKRTTFTTGGGAGSVSGVRSTALEVWRGNSAGRGGFFYLTRFALETTGASMRAFAGLYDTLSFGSIDPTTSTTPGKIGMAISVGTGNWNLVHNITGTAPTIIPLGASFPVDTTTVYELILFCPPGGASVNYRITNLVTAAQTSGSLSTNIPASTTFLGTNTWVGNNAGPGSRAMSVLSIYLEADA